MWEGAGGGTAVFGEDVPKGGLDQGAATVCSFHAAGFSVQTGGGYAAAALPCERRATPEGV